MLTKLRAGGGFETLMSENGGAYQPHVEGCFLDIVPQQRIVFTTLLKQGWQPIEPWLAMTSIITMEDEAGGTKYIARALHRNPTDSQKHEEMGFHKGWAGVGAKRPALRAFLSLVAAYLRIPAERVTGWLCWQSAANGSRRCEPIRGAFARVILPFRVLLGRFRLRLAEFVRVFGVLRDRVPSAHVLK